MPLGYQECETLTHTENLVNRMSRVDMKNGGAFDISLGGHVVQRYKKTDVCRNLLNCDAAVFFVGLLD